MFDIIKPQHPRQLEFLMLSHSLHTCHGQEGEEEEHVVWVRVVCSKNGNKFKKPKTNSCDFFGDNCCTAETGNLKLRTKICDWNWEKEWEWNWEEAA